MNDTVRKIIHVDMDAFYASVEQRDNPELRGKPLVVGGKPDSRSVVAAASYEARKFGIRSAMPCSHAVRLCPHAVFVLPRFDAYKRVSSEVMAIFREYTDLVEPLSLDEAYLDVTENKRQNPSATRIAEEIRLRIFQQTALTASAGVAPSKFLAKVASDMNKPNGLTVIPPERVEEVLISLAIRAVPGVGPKTEEKMRSLGIETVGQLRELSLEVLEERFGKSGGWYYRICRGEDQRAVISERERKSVGAEDTFSTDLTDLAELHVELQKLGAKVWRRLGERPGRTVTLKVTYAGFEKATRSRTLELPPSSEAELLSEAVELLKLTDATRRPIRLLGISVSNFELPQADGQLCFPWR